MADEESSQVDTISHRLLIQNAAHLSPYSSIASDQGEIRLVQLLPGNYDDTLELKLQCVQLSDDPIFTALSYAWGTEISTQKALVDGALVSITESLDCALRHLRSSTIITVLWIDALCIDQENIEERSHQVKLMGRIYSSAHKVMIWLGPLENDGNERLLEFLFSDVSLAQAADWDLPMLFSAIIQRPWFTRVWVVQEFVLAKDDPVLAVGVYRITWSRFVLRAQIPYAAYLPGWGNAGDCQTKLASLIGWRDKSFLTHATDLLFQLDATNDRSATDVRDKVFALLGLVTFKHHSIIPDYSHSVRRVFSQASAVLITENFRSTYLKGRLIRTKDTNTIKLPSWAFDVHTAAQPWMNRLSTYNEYSGLENLYPEVSPSVRFTDEYEELRTIGRYHGKVTIAFKNPFPSLWAGLLNYKWHIINTVFSRPDTSFQRLVHTVQGSFEKLDQTVVDSFGQQRIAKLRYIKEQCGKLLNEARDQNMYLSREDAETLLHPRVDYSLHIFRTDEGHIGLSYHPDDEGMQAGDHLVGLFGVDLPFILRPVGERYEIINVAWVVNHKPAHYLPEKIASKLDWANLEILGLKEYAIV